MPITTTTQFQRVNAFTWLTLHRYVGYSRSIRSPRFIDGAFGPGVSMKRVSMTATRTFKRLRAMWASVMATFKTTDGNDLALTTAWNNLHSDILSVADLEKIGRLQSA